MKEGREGALMCVCGRGREEKGGKKKYETVGEKKSRKKERERERERATGDSF